MTRVTDARLLEALLRSDFPSFARSAFSAVVPGEQLAWNWHLDAICHQLERVRSGEVRRLIIEVPPRSLKTFLCSVAFPAFCLGRDPNTKFINASYSLDLSIKVGNDFRTLVRSDRYRSLFPHLREAPGKDTETEFVTPQRGFRYATSNGGTLTGRGADIIILDDPMKADDAMSEAKRRSLHDWYCNTVYTRLNSKQNGAIILVMQRLHIDDLAGHLRAQGGWEVLSLPAEALEAQHIAISRGRTHHRQLGELLHPAREPKAVLDDIRQTIGSYLYSAQYQQEPVPIEGELVKWRWFRTFKTVPDRDRRIVQSWDVAIKAEQVNDFSVCTTWAIIGQDYYLLHLHRERLAFPDLRRRAIELARRWRVDSIVIEDKATGSALIQQLREERLVGVPAPIAFNPTIDKVSRLSAETAVIEAGRVHLQEGATWLGDLRAELVQFPNGRHDDQVDSISQFLNWARTRNTRGIGTVRVR